MGSMLYSGRAGTGILTLYLEASITSLIIEHPMPALQADAPTPIGESSRKNPVKNLGPLLVVGGCWSGVKILLSSSFASTLVEFSLLHGGCSIFLASDQPSWAIFT
jgi:hypothetical protein